MKRKNNRQEVDTLFILGAGASHGLTSVKARTKKHHKHTTPLDSDFLACLQDHKPSTGWRRGSTELIHSEWFDREAAVNHGLEEAIIKRVSQYDFLSNLHPTRVGGKCSNEDYLNHLSHLITAYLSKCKANSSGNAKTLINKIFPPKTDPKTYRNRIITFNYDIVLERPLIERGLSRKRLYFDRIALKKEQGTRRASHERFLHPLILKLHGSINWKCERQYFDQLITGKVSPNEKITIWSDEGKLPRPEDDVSPLIIPPIPNKPITQARLFNLLWTLAFEYIHEAKRIVIVGYSCPPTDSLAQTLFGQFSSKKLEEVLVVDPDAGLLKRYREMFDPATASRAKWGYFNDIAEYIESDPDLS